MKKKHLLVALMSLTAFTSSFTPHMPMAKTDATVKAATLEYKKSTISQLGKLKTVNSRIYTAPASKTSSVASTKYTNEIFYVMKKAVAASGDTYYQISRQSDPNKAVIGWIKAKSISLQSYTVQKNVKKTLYIKGTGAAYTRPGGLPRNILLPTLTAYKDQTFTTTMTVKVGKTIWYRAVVKGKTLWLPATALQAKKSVVVIPSPLVTTTSKIARLKSTTALILTDLQNSKTTVNPTAIANRTLTVTKQAIYNKKTYYLLSDQSKSIGWVAVTDVTSYAYQPPSTKNSTLNLTGGGYGYSIPWGNTADITLKPLTTLANTALSITKTATVGKTVWYFGTTTSGQKIWVSSTRTEALKPVIAAPVATATAVIARLNTDTALILQDLQQAETKVNPANLLKRTLVVTKTAQYNNKSYYLLTDNMQEIGWVSSDEVTSYAYKVPSASNLTLYLTGGGYGYSMPWGADKDITLKPLTDLKNTVFTTTKKATVGKTIWYFGTTTSGQQIWVSSNRTMAELAAAITYTNNQRQATLKPAAKWFSSLSTMATRIPTTAEQSEKFSMTRSAKVGNSEYYELKRTSTAGKTTVVGWVLASDTTSSKVAAPTATTSTLYVTGIGAAYNLPSASATPNTVYSSLSTYAATKFSATSTQIIGTTTYYYGKLGSKYVWLKADQFGLAYQYFNVRKPSNITIEDMQKYLKYKKGDAIITNNLYKTIPVFIDMQKKYGINAQFMLAHAIWETGWGGSAISQYKNNFFGYQAYDSCAMTCAMYFPTGTDGIQYYADAIYRKYLRVGAIYNNGTSPAGMNVRYATDKTWAYNIARLMQEMKPYDADYYNSVAASTSDPVVPVFNYSNVIPANQPQPSTYMNFDSGITATTTVLTTAKALPYLYGKDLVSYPVGQKITLSGTNADVATSWMRVKIGEQEGWISRSSLKFTNLGLTTTEANIRDLPTTVASTVLLTIKANTYFKVVLASDGTAVTKKDDKKVIWYNIQLPGKKTTGWISSTIVKIQ